MSANYSPSLKTDRMTAVKNKVDAGAGPGYIEIGTANMATVLTTVTLADPCGTVTADTLALTMPQTDPNADAGGIAAAARVRDSDGSDVITGLTVGLSATDILISDVDITVNQPVTINSATIQHA